MPKKWQYNKLFRRTRIMAVIFVNPTYFDGNVGNLKNNTNSYINQRF